MLEYSQMKHTVLLVANEYCKDKEPDYSTWVNNTIDMSKNLSRDAAELLQVIERAPGHTRDELMKLAGFPEDLVKSKW